MVTLTCWDGVCSAVPGVGCDGAANSGPLRLMLWSCVEFAIMINLGFHLIVSPPLLPNKVQQNLLGGGTMTVMRCGTAAEPHPPPGVPWVMSHERYMLRFRY